MIGTCSESLKPPQSWGLLDQLFWYVQRDESVAPGDGGPLIGRQRWRSCSEGGRCVAGGACSPKCGRFKIRNALHHDTGPSGLKPTDHQLGQFWGMENGDRERLTVHEWKGRDAAP